MFDSVQQLFQDAGLPCIVLNVLSIIALLMVILTYHSCPTPGMGLIMVVCYADVLWQLLVILNIIFLMPNAREPNLLNGVLILSASTVAPVASGFPAVIAICAYLSVSRSQSFVTDMQLKISLLAIVIQMFMGFVGGLFPVLPLFADHMDEKYQLLYTSTAMLLLYPFTMVVITVYCYLSIYYLIRLENMSLTYKVAISRVFIFPIVMCFTLFWPFAVCLLDLIDSTNEANKLIEIICLTVFSLQGTFDALAYGFNLKQRSSVTGVDSQLSSNSTLNLTESLLTSQSLR